MLFVGVVRGSTALALLQATTYHRIHNSMSTMLFMFMLVCVSGVLLFSGLVSAFARQSCAGLCGSFAPDRECFCDGHCAEKGDCCEDFEDECDVRVSCFAFLFVFTFVFSFGCCQDQQHKRYDCLISRHRCWMGCCVVVAFRGLRFRRTSSLAATATSVCGMQAGQVLVRHLP